MDPTPERDFGLGCLGSTLANVVIALLATLLAMGTPDKMPAIWIGVSVALGLNVAGIVIAIRRERPNAAAGVAVAILLPLLVFGGCFVMLGGLRR